MSCVFDPFKVFEIDYIVDILDLDDLYYDLIQKEGVSLEAVNLAYQHLKDPVKRLSFLCSKYVNSKNLNLLQKLLLKLSEGHAPLSEDVLLSLARSENWNECWIELQFLLKTSETAVVL